MRESGFEDCRYRTLLSLNQKGQIRQTGPSNLPYVSELYQKEIYETSLIPLQRGESRKTDAKG
jgi:hypothetical protein